MAASNRAPMRVVGRYALYAEIAAGGMATVHFGRLLGPVGFSRTVAIKRLHPQFAKDPEFVSMFLDEARLAARIRHPNVVPTLDVVATNGELFLVMEYVQGESLSRLVRALRDTGQRTPPRIVASIMSGALHGLHAAHEARNERGEPLGIVHRDISPQNVLVGSDGVARVLDFGVAKAAGRIQTTREGQLKGKLAYMAPEQLTGVVSRQTDIYAAAIVLWEALTGRRLFSGDNEAVVLGKVLSGVVEPPSKFILEGIDGLPEGMTAQGLQQLDYVTLRGMDRDPSKRYTTAREMAIALEKCIGLASPSEVGEWVETTAREVLHRRAEKIAEIESTSSQVHVNTGQLVNQLKTDPPTLPEHPGMEAATDPAPPLSSRGTVAGVALGKLHAPPTPQGLDPDSQLSSISLSRNGDLTSMGLGPRRRMSLLFAMIAVLTAVVTVVTVGLIVKKDRRVHEPSAASGSTGTPAGSGTVADPALVGSLSASPPATASIAFADPVAPDAGKAQPAPSGTPTAPTGSAGAAAAKPKSGSTSTGTGAKLNTTSSEHPRPATPKVDCNPPFVFDAAGHKKYKMECFK